MKRALAGVLLVAACGGEPLPPVPYQPPVPIVVPPIAVGVDAGAGYVAVVAPVEAVDVAPAFEGILTAVLARPGDRVAAGQVIAELDPRPLREELALATAALRAAKASARQARVDVRDAAREVKSEQRAVADGVSPKRQLEEATYALERARAAAARASATVSEEEARLDRAKSRLDDTSVRAPFAGTVAQRLRDRGAGTGPGAPVVRLLGQGGLRVRFAVPPEDARAFAPGNPVMVDIEGSDGEERGTVRQVSPELDAPSRLVFIEAELDRPDVALQPGLPARVRRAP